MDSIVAKYQWTLGELTKSLRWHNRQIARPIFRFAFYALLVLFCVAGTGLLLAGEISAGATVGGFGLTSLILTTAAAPLSARLQFRRSPIQNKEIEWRLSPSNIQIISLRGKIQADWSLLVKVAESPDGLLFYFAPQVFNWLPRGAFANDAEYAAAVDLVKKNCQTFERCDRSLFQGFRFTVRSILSATFWVCIWMGALSHLITFVKVHRPLQGVALWTMLIAFWIPLFIVVWSPTVAIGALFNNARRGAMIGLIPVVVIVILVLAVAI